MKTHATSHKLFRCLTSLAVVLAILTTASPGRADCPAAPIGDANDLVVSFLKANGTQAAPASLLASSVKEGMLIYDGTADQLKICDGTNWTTVGSGGSVLSGGTSGYLGIWSGATTMGLSGTSAGTQLFWDGTNNRLGIGLVAPVAPLHVHASGTDLKFYLTNASTGATATDGGWLQVDSSRDFTIMNRENAHMFLATNNNPRMTIRNDGNVGIGTTAPQSLLHVAGGVQLGDDTATCPGASNVKLGTMRFNSGNLEVCKAAGWTSTASGGSSVNPQFSAMASVAQTLANSAYTKLNFGTEQFDTNNNFASSRFTVTQPGKYLLTATVAIDDTSGGLTEAWIMLYKNGGSTVVSGNRLSADSGGSAANLYPSVTTIVDAGAGDYFEVYARQSDVFGSTQSSIPSRTYFQGAYLGGGGGGSATAAGSTGQIQFNGGSSTFAADASLHWDNTNKLLGIGTSSPATQLHVYGATADTTIMAQNGGGNVSQVILKNSTTGGREYALRAWGSASNGDFSIDDNTAPARRFTIASGGNVGIGTATPASLLQVAGGVQMGNDAATCPGASNIKLGTLKFASDTLSICKAAGWQALGAGGSASAAGATGQIQFNGGSSTFAADAGLHWDNTNKRLGIGTAAPVGPLTIVATGTTGGEDDDFSIRSYQSVSASSAPGVDLLRGRGSSASPTTVLAGDALGNLWFGGHNGTAINNYTANLGAVAEGNFNTSLATAFTFTTHNGTANGERMRITGAGNVGIGTASPASLLHINSADYGVVQLGNNDSGGFHLTKEATDDSFNIWSGAFGSGLNRLKITSGGNVGIGTANPGSLLHVAKSSQAYTSSNSFGLVVSDGVTQAKVLALGYDATIDAGVIQATHQAVGTKPLILQGTGGNVGIGTTTPAAPLSVGTATGGGAIALGATNSTVEGAQIDWRGASTYDNWYTDVAANDFRIFTGSANANMVSIFNNNAGEAGLYVEGKAGIGTTPTAYKLTVVGDIYANGGWLRTSGNAGWYSESYGGGWYMTDTTWLRAYGSKNVYTPAIMRADTQLQTPNLCDTNGNQCSSIAGLYYVHNNYYSDRRLKKNIVPLPDSAGLDSIMKLRPVTFDWRDKSTAVFGRQMGLIAQEVEEVLPEAVDTMPDRVIEDDDGKKETIKSPKMVAYQSLVVPLIKSVQELKADNDSLRAELKAANDNYIELRHEIEALKSARQ